MEVNCPKCQTENWLENQSRCFRCGAVLRRCTDCTRYKRDAQHCSATGDEVSLHESENPGPLAESATCQSYDPQPRVLAKTARAAQALADKSTHAPV